MFRRKSTPPSTRPELERKVDSYRPPHGDSQQLAPEPIADEDVTGVIDLALERVSTAQHETSDALRRATEHLLRETGALRALTDPPKEPPR